MTRKYVDGNDKSLGKYHIQLQSFIYIFQKKKSKGAGMLSMFKKKEIDRRLKKGKKPNISG